jgi:hypothetical protein
VSWSDNCCRLRGDAGKGERWGGERELIVRI